MTHSITSACTRVAAVLDMKMNGSQLARRAGEQTAQTHPALEGREHPSCKTRVVQRRHRYLRERWTWWRAPTLPPTPGSRTCPSRLRGAATHTPEGVGQTSSHGVVCGWETESQEGHNIVPRRSRSRASPSASPSRGQSGSRTAEWYRWTSAVSPQEPPGAPPARFSGGVSGAGPLRFGIPWTEQEFLDKRSGRESRCWVSGGSANSSRMG